MTQQLHRRTTARIMAGTLAVSVAAGAALLGTAAPASAAGVHAQAVGRFLDGALGGMPIQSIADLHDARASYPGTTSTQNPLDVTLGGQADIPLTGKLQTSGNNIFHAGAANQVAAARANGYARGAAGAVANQGGASLGGQDGSPSNATLTLSGAALPSAPIPLPGGTNKNSLGGLTAEIGAVAADAQAPVNGAPFTRYNIGSFQLVLGSPALGGVLTTLANALSQPAPLPPSPLPTSPPKACQFKGQALSTITLADGAVTIDPTTGTLTIDVAALLRTLGANINTLPANTDLLGYVTSYLASSHGLSAGLQRVLTNSFDEQKQNFADCIGAIPGAFPPPLDTALKQAVKAFKNAILQGQQQLVGALDQVTSKLGGGPNPFQPLVDGLKQALQIGVNVQPNGPHGSYSSPLAATPDQATAVIGGQTIVRAIEIDLGGGSGVDLALANAAASSQRSSTPPPPPSTTAAVKHDHHLPTGVPAGQAPTGGGPQLPLVLLTIGVVLAAAGGIVYRVRPHRH